MPVVAGLVLVALAILRRLTLSASVWRHRRKPEWVAGPDTSQPLFYFFHILQKALPVKAFVNVCLNVCLSLYLNLGTIG